MAITSKLKAARWLPFFLLVATYVGLVILGPHAWLLRLCAEVFYLSVMIIVISYAGLSSKYVVVKGGKLAAKERARERALVERLSKAFFVCCSLLIFFVLFLPLLKGTFALSRGRPLEIITGEVTTTSTWVGTWFLNQNIQVKDQHGSLHYSFSAERPIRIGDRYHFTVLPGTRFVLDIQPETGSGVTSHKS